MIKSEQVKNLHNRYAELRAAGIKDIQLSYIDTAGHKVRVRSPGNASSPSEYQSKKQLHILGK